LELSRVWHFCLFALIPVGACVLFRFARWRVLRLGAGLVAIAGTLALVLGLPAGSVDVSDLWEFMPIVLVGAPPVFGMRSGGWRRTISAVLAVPLGIALLLMCFVQGACVRRALPDYSPDGKTVVFREIFMQGALGADYAKVTVRRWWSPFGELVFSGEGDLESPEVQWIGTSRLRIRYWDDGSRTPRSVCNSGVGLVVVVCEIRGRALKETVPHGPVFRGAGLGR